MPITGELLEAYHKAMIAEKPVVQKLLLELAVTCDQKFITVLARATGVYFNFTPVVTILDATDSKVPAIVLLRTLMKKRGTELTLREGVEIVEAFIKDGTLPGNYWIQGSGKDDE